VVVVVVVAWSWMGRVRLRVPDLTVRTVLTMTRGSGRTLRKKSWGRWCRQEVAAVLAHLLLRL
jgi:hypothetical protein